MDTLSKVSNDLQQSYLNSIRINGFELLNKSATPISDSSETYLDYFITQVLENLAIEVMENDCVFDHNR